MKLCESNPYVRYAQAQPAVLEGTGERMAYDHRIFCIRSGDGCVTVQGQNVDAEPDLFVFLPPRTGYNFRGKISVLVLNFDLTRACAGKPPVFPSPAGEFDERKLLDMTTAEGFDKPLILHGQKLLREAVTDIVRKFLPADAVSDARTSAALKALLADLASGRSAEDRLAERIAGYLRLNAAEKVENEMLAREFGYHPVYLGQVFKRATGKTIHRVLTEERVRLACVWLAQTDHDIETIAFDTGFCSRSHFCTVFKRMTGVSPAAFRRGRDE